MEFKSIDYQLQPYTNPELIKENGPQVFRSGRGVEVKDIDGNSYIEGMSGLWCASLGFNEIELVEAAITQMKKLPFYHSFTGKTCESTINLSEKLIEVAPNNLKKIFFCNSGSEANDTMIKMLWMLNLRKGNPHKRKIISNLQNSKINMIFGTHSLFQKKTIFNKLGFIIIDEQHKFGVKQRKLLSDKGGSNCDILLMSATPIPRTLTMTIYGDMDLSIINEKPKNRKEIITYSKKEDNIKDVINGKQLCSGGHINTSSVT